MSIKTAKYTPRLIDSIIKQKLDLIGAIQLRGPKWCGKTTTAEQFSSSQIYLDDPEKGEANIAIAKLSPSRLLSGDTPRLIDEWQLAPNLWDAIRFTIDRRGGKPGQFILTGSASPLEEERRKQIHHTGTGRISRLTMRTMSLYESGDSTGEVSIKELFSSPDDIYAQVDPDLEKVAFLCCRGGWPIAVLNKKLTKETAGLLAEDYMESICSSDIPIGDVVIHDYHKMKQFFRSYARNIGSQSPLTSIEEDCKNYSVPISRNSISEYKKALDETFTLEDMAAWNPNLRSKVSVRAASTRYFTDPSIATAALGAGVDDLLSDIRTFGFIFENLCIRDLRIYAQCINGDVFHYRDSNGLECDAVIHLKNGSYGLIEIKLGGEEAIEKGAKSLLKLASIIDTEKMKSPSFLLVLTAISPYAYKRSDGVYVAPIDSLKP